MIHSMREHAFDRAQLAVSRGVGGDVEMSYQTDQKGLL